MQIGLHLFGFLLERGDLLTDRLALGDQGLFPGRILLGRDALGELVAFLLQNLRFAHQLLAPVVQLNNLVGLGVGRLAVDAISLHGRQIVANKTGIEHGRRFRILTRFACD